MAGGIFVSYRRDDAKHAAGRLVDRLSQAFGPDQLFLDVDNIAPGLDFKKVLAEKVQACDVLLAVIGPGWLASVDERGSRRLDNPNDFVRIEIEAALLRDIRVIPVLVDGAPMPGERELPDTLRSLAGRNAVRLAHERFGADASDLTAALAKVIVPARKGWFTPSGLRSQLGKATAATQNAHRAKGSDALAIVVAAAFAVAALPLSNMMMRTFHNARWNLFVSDIRGMGAAVTGELVSAVSLVVVALLMARYRGTAFRASEAVLYWLGSAMCVALAVPKLFYQLDLRLFGSGQDGALFSGFLVGALLALLSGSTLLVWWRRRRAA